MSISLCPAPSLIVPLLTVLSLFASSFTVLSRPVLFCSIPFPPLPSSPLPSRDLLFSYLIFADSNPRYVQLFFFVVVFLDTGRWRSSAVVKCWCSSVLILFTELVSFTHSWLAEGDTGMECPNSSTKSCLEATPREGTKRLKYRPSRKKNDSYFISNFSLFQALERLVRTIGKAGGRRVEKSRRE